MSAIQLQYTISDLEINRYNENSTLVGGWGEPEYESRPNAVISRARVLFLFNGEKKRTMSKVLKAKVILREEDPDEASWFEAESKAYDLLIEEVRMHGLEL